MEEITEAMETLELELVDECAETMSGNVEMGSSSSSRRRRPNGSHYQSNDNRIARDLAEKCDQRVSEPSVLMTGASKYTPKRRSSCGSNLSTPNVQKNDSATSLSTVSPFRRLTPVDKRSNVYLGRQSSATTSDSGIGSTAYLATTFSSRSSSPIVKSIGVGTVEPKTCDKSVNSSPHRMVSVMCSPIEPQEAETQSCSSIMKATREYALKQEIDVLQERLKDTEERLESFRLQYDTLSQLHRKLRDGHTNLQDETEMLKLDVQHLNECANVLRAELQAARTDRDASLELQKLLQTELEEIKVDKKRSQEQKDKDMKTIQDLQRQCREMERILMRKHPDSVSALIGIYI